MAASSVNSQPKGKRSIKPDDAIDARAALEILYSAVVRCQKAGIAVSFVNRPRKLALFFDNAEYAGGAFVPVENTDTGIQEVPTP